MIKQEEKGKIKGPSPVNDLHKEYFSKQNLFHSRAPICFNAGVLSQLPFYYLGVPVFKVKPRKIHLQPIADRIILKLVSWKGLFLSIMRRVKLVNSNIQGMFNLQFPDLPLPWFLLKEVDKNIRNFIWSGQVDKRKTATAINNSSWLVGNGESISFWTMKWLFKPIYENIGLPSHLNSKLNSTVSMFLHNGC